MCCTCGSVLPASAALQERRRSRWLSTEAPGSPAA
jgi:hypothetical protein